MTETQFKLSIPNSHQQYLHVELKINSNSDQIEILLPTWRPGRYELGNFAKNIKGFKVFSDQNKALNFTKTSKHCWSIDSKNTKHIRIQYQYYSAELNAGSTFVNNNILYCWAHRPVVYSFRIWLHFVSLKLDVLLPMLLRHPFSAIILLL